MGRRVGHRKAEEEPIVGLWATTTTQRGARPVVRVAGWRSMGDALCQARAAAGLDRRRAMPDRQTNTARYPARIAASVAGDRVAVTNRLKPSCSRTIA